MRALVLVLAGAVLACAAAPTRADTLIAARTIRAQTILAATDVTTVAAQVPGALSDAAAVVGQEARVVLYAGRPIRPGDVGPPAIVDRNQIVPLAYRRGTLTILAEGRALGRGGVGDAIRVMNTSSRSTVTGVVGPDGTVTVGPGH